MHIFFWNKIYLIFFLTLLPLLWGSGELRAELPAKRPLAFDAEEALRLSQDALGRPLENYTLRNRSGNSVALNVFNGKPLLLSLVYTSCYHTCSVATLSLAGVVEKAREALGKESFNVVTVGFDTTVDNPVAMAVFARQQGLDKDEHWFFLSGDRNTLKRLVKNIGFSAVPSPKGFDHLVQTTVIDGNGVIYRQLYGEVIPTPLLVEPLKNLVLGRPSAKENVIQDMVRRVRFFCTSYDPARDGYRFDYSIFVGMFIGAMIIIIAFYQIFKEIRRSKKLGKYY